MDYCGRILTQIVGGTVYLYSGTAQGAFSKFSTNSDGLLKQSCLKNPHRVLPTGATREEQINEVGYTPLVMEPNGKWKKRFIVFQATCAGWVVTIYRPKKDAVKNLGTSGEATTAEDFSPSRGRAHSSPSRSHPDNRRFMQMIENGLAEVKCRIFLGPSANVYRTFQVSESDTHFKDVQIVDSFTGVTTKTQVESFVTLNIPKYGMMEFCGRDGEHTSSWFHRMEAVLDLNSKIHVAGNLYTNPPVQNLQSGTFFVTTQHGDKYQGRLVAVTLPCEYSLEIEGEFVAAPEHSGTVHVDPSQNETEAGGIPPKKSCRRWRIVWDQEPVQDMELHENKLAVVEVSACAPPPPTLKLNEHQKFQVWAKERGSSARECDAKGDHTWLTITSPSPPPNAQPTWEAQFSYKWHSWLRQLKGCADIEESAETLTMQASFAFHKHEETLGQPEEPTFSPIPAAASTDDVSFSSETGEKDGGAVDDEEGPTTREIMTSFYKKHCPEKLVTLDALMTAFEGRHNQLMSSAEKRYNCPGETEAIRQRLIEERQLRREHEAKRKEDQETAAAAAVAETKVRQKEPVSQTSAAQDTAEAPQPAQVESMQEDATAPAASATEAEAATEAPQPIMGFNLAPELQAAAEEEQQSSSPSPSKRQRQKLSATQEAMLVEMEAFARVQLEDLEKTVRDGHLGSNCPVLVAHTTRETTTASNAQPAGVTEAESEGAPIFDKEADLVNAVPGMLAAGHFVEAMESIQRFRAAKGER